MRMNFFRLGAVLVLGGISILSGCDMGDAEARRQRMHLPAPDFMGNPGEGKRLYVQYCVTCHGHDGRGSEQGPALVHPLYAASHHANLAFHLAVGDGVKQHHWQFGDMPPQPDVSPESAEHIITYLRQLQRQAGIQ
jgi:cytochrome c